MCAKIMHPIVDRSLFHISFSGPKKEFDFKYKLQATASSKAELTWLHACRTQLVIKFDLKSLDKQQLGKNGFKKILVACSVAYEVMKCDVLHIARWPKHLAKGQFEKAMRGKIFKN
jgi:hypothetical protein